MENYTWPNPSCSFEPITEICHAIGVININWAWCETVHEELIADYLRIDWRIMSRITNTMPNRSRSELLEALATEYYPDPMRRASVLHFVRWFDITRENRNLLTHSPLVIETPENGGPFFSQARAGVEIRHRSIPVTAELLISVCDETERLYEFGAAIVDSYIPGTPHSLPDRFPLPRKLSLLHPAQIT